MMLGKMRCKTCRVCKQEKTIRNFYKHPTTVDGYMYICRACHKAYTYANKDLKRDVYNINRRRYNALPEVKEKRRLYLARPEVKEKLRENARINKILKIQLGL